MTEKKRNTKVYISLRYIRGEKSLMTVHLIKGKFKDKDVRV